MTDEQLASSPSLRTDPAIRLQNVREMLDVLIGAGPTRAVTRDALIGATGLARATVIRGLSALREWNDGLAPPALDFIGEQGKTGRAEYLKLLDPVEFAVGVEFSHRRITAARGDIWGRIRAREDWETVEFDVDSNPHGSLEIAADLLRRVVGDRDLDHLIGVGVAVAAPIDPSTGEVQALRGDPQPGRLTWVGQSPAAKLEAYLADWPRRFFVDNDANFAALDEYRWLSTHNDPPRDLLHLKWASGLGAAIVLDGEVHRGVDGLAGELGHTLVVGAATTEHCVRCGHGDCLEVLTSYASLKRKAGMEDATRDQFEGTELGRELLAEAALTIGRSLGGAVNLVNPKAIVISGPGADVAPMIAAQVEVGLKQTAVASAARGVNVYVARRRWTGAGDERGHLAVVSGAIGAVVEARAGVHLLGRLSGFKIPGNEVALDDLVLEGSTRSLRTDVLAARD